MTQSLQSPHFTARSSSCSSSAYPGIPVCMATPSWRLNCGSGIQNIITSQVSYARCYPVSAASYLPGFRLAFLAHLDSDSVNHKSSSSRSRRMKGTLYRCIFYRSRIPVPSCCASNRGSCLSSVFKWLLVVAECPVLAHLERGIMTAIHCFVVGLRKRADKLPSVVGSRGRQGRGDHIALHHHSFASDTAASCSVDNVPCRGS